MDKNPNRKSVLLLGGHGGQSFCNPFSFFKMMMRNDQIGVTINKPVEKYSVPTMVRGINRGVFRTSGHRRSIGFMANRRKELKRSRKRKMKPSAR